MGGDDICLFKLPLRCPQILGPAAFWMIENNHHGASQTDRPRRNPRQPRIGAGRKARNGCPHACLNDAHQGATLGGSKNDLVSGLHKVKYFGRTSFCCCSNEKSSCQHVGTSSVSEGNDMPARFIGFIKEIVLGDHKH